MDHYIVLKTKKELSKKELYNWFNIINQFIQNDAIKNKKIKIKNKIHEYKLELNNHISPDDFIFINYAWESLYHDEFEIKISDEYSLQEDEFNSLKERISKYLHNRWVDDKISEGWRYGLYENNKDKTSPRLRDWDSLPSKYRTILELDIKKAVDFSKKYL